VVAAGVHGAGTRTFTASGTTSSKETNTSNNTASVNVSVAAGSVVAKGFSTGTIAVPIPTLGAVDVPLTVPLEGTAVQVAAYVRLNHTFDEDLDIFLVSPTGKTVELSSDNGAGSDNYGSGTNDCAGTRTAFTDLSGTLISAGTPPFSGSFAPEQPISNLLLDPIDGVWKLHVVDDAAPDGGTIGCFALAITRRP
jgi:subtilisin-like proprotein convertase family protein